LDTDPRLIRGFQIVAGIIALLILVQAALAGQFEHNGADLKGVHAMMGNVIFMLALVQLALAWLTRDAWRYKMVIWAGVVLLLIVAQIGLGYTESGDASAIHIPLGVFLFALSSIIAMLSMMDERAKSVLSGSR
jgi:heme A synthase